MKNPMNIFISLFKRRRTTDSIVRPLTKIVNALDAHAKQQAHAAQNTTVKAAQLLSQSEAHRTESQAAADRRAKIADLIGS